MPSPCAKGFNHGGGASRSRRLQAHLPSFGSHPQAVRKTFSGSDASGPGPVENELSSPMSVLTDIRNRGTRDVFFFVCDGLGGLPEVVGNDWPLTTV